MKNKKSELQEQRSVILLSGGLDSAVTLYFAKKYGYDLTALIFSYGQRHEKETECAKKLADMVGINKYLLEITLPWSESALINRSIEVPYGRDLEAKDIPLTYVPGRNIIFLSYAFSLAETIKAKRIFIGAHVEDYSGYPDCRPEFINSFEDACNKGISRNGIEISAPLLDKNKKDIITLGNELNVPFENTWSCYSGTDKPCMKCDSCRFRQQGFEALGLVDPLIRDSK
ncbi:MAG: 7-cyano-7-deazaguanine synthase QueC [Candidatus Omnitrophica bacterium]|nr:7-cyano-7-deazaguanine synthase QueC [Candidatus Omnitrophota bacterium]MDD5081460.1 7-cyano-7-deazaguanine synthase QueC [Candidatus Omnitrophota bacterium]